jgi:hypothetical protein
MRKLLIITVTGLLFVGIAAGQAAGQCNRQCLEGFVNQYLNAMVAHDVSKAPFAKNARYTEDAKDISFAKPTEGLWAASTSLGDYKLYVADPQQGQVAFVGLVKEGGKPAILSMRLKIENQKITEIESIVVRNITEANLWTMKTVPVEFTRALDPKERVSRQELVRLSKGYFEAIVKSNSKLVSWSDECYRLENGMWTAGTKLPPELAANEPKNAPKMAAKVAGPGAKTPSPSPAFNRGSCTAGIDSGVFALIESIEPRRTPVVDEERGITWGVYVFNHPGVKEVKMPDGSIKPAAYFAGQPNSMPISELFKIKGGKIRDIMAVGVINKYKSDSGWK